MPPPRHDTPDSSPSGSAAPTPPPVPLATGGGRRLPSSIAGILDAEDVGHPRVVMILKRAVRTLKRQLCGMRTMDEKVAGASRTTRLLDEQSVLSVRRGFLGDA